MSYCFFVVFRIISNTAYYLTLCRFLNISACCLHKIYYNFDIVYDKAVSNVKNVYSDFLAVFRMLHKMVFFQD